MQIELHFVQAADHEISVYIEPFLEIPWKRLPDGTIEVDDVYQYDVRVSVVHMPDWVPEDRRAEFRRSRLTGIDFVV
jgi:hypothetical protein